MLRSIIVGIILSVILILSSCNKSNTTSSASPQLIFKFVFDSTQVRLDAHGNLEPNLPAGHAAQNPQMNVMSAHYIEMSQHDTDSLGKGTILYMTPNTASGAIDFAQEVLTSNNSVFYKQALSTVTPGTYKWLRVSLAYQNYTVKLYYDTTITGSQSGVNYSVPVQAFFPATIASFVGFKTYITSYKINTQSITVNGDKAQGYWGFESVGTYNGNYGGVPYSYPYSFIRDGQAQPGETTVVNPLFASSPLPAGSCVATGQFSNSSGSTIAPLTITGHETSDIVVVVSLSVNKSFEWEDSYNPDGKWEPSKGERIVDMGIRGLIPKVQ